MATPATYNFPNHYKGDTFKEVNFTLTNTVGGTPIDLTDATIECKFRKDGKTGKVQLSIDTTSGITLTDAVNGVFTIDEFQLDWNAGKYYYDIEVTYLDGTIRTYVEGTIIIEQDVTY